MKVLPSLKSAIEYSRDYLLNTGQKVMAKSWQGTKSPAPMFEAMDLSFKCPIPEGIEAMQHSTECNLPWAEAHFQERISGIPYNPPPSHSIWPFGVKNNKEFTGDDEKFDHTYPERFWPKKAGNFEKHRVSHGIRFELGDLNDLINLLGRDPLTRQAYLPIFFPEDTGSKGGKGRVPCTLGYHFIQRNGFLHCSYFMRSCDYNRHFRDDLYMACRLTEYIAEQITMNTAMVIKPGMLKFYATSFHIFYYEKLKM